MLHGVAHRPLVDYIGLIVGRDDAEDVVQEAYIKVLSTTAPHEGRSSLKTWVYAIARNTAFDHLRARSREPASTGLGIATQEAGQEGTPRDVHAVYVDGRRHVYLDVPDPAKGSDDHVSWSIDVRRAIDALKPMYREAVEIVLVHGSIPSAARALGLTNSAMKARYFRAVAVLKRELTGRG